MSNQEQLQVKAEQVCTWCVEAGFPRPTFRIVSDYAIDFTWFHAGKKHTLSLYWNPKYKQWKADPKTDWLKQEVVPTIPPLLSLKNSRPHQATITTAVTPEKAAAPVETGNLLQLYFADACNSLTLLEPFAQDNVDCSIICIQAKEALVRILDDPACSYLDHAALETMLNQPNSSNFSRTKEYLTQCLTLCNISAILN